MTECTCEPCRRLAKFVQLDPDARARKERWQGDDADTVLGLVDDLRDRLRGRDIEIDDLTTEVEDLRAQLDEAIDGLRWMDEDAIVRYLKAQIAAREEKIKELEAAIIVRNTRIAARDETIKELQAEIDDLRSIYSGTPLGEPG